MAIEWNVPDMRGYWTVPGEAVRERIDDEHRENGRGASGTRRALLRYQAAFCGGDFLKTTQEKEHEITTFRGIAIGSAACRAMIQESGAKTYV